MADKYTKKAVTLAISGFVDLIGIVFAIGAIGLLVYFAPGE